MDKFSELKAVASALKNMSNRKEKGLRTSPLQINAAAAKMRGMLTADAVLALLAELEAKDKRIAELERANTSQDDHINQQQDRIDSLEKTNAGLGQRLGDAEKRLAAPVRLPDIRSDDYHVTGWFQHMKYYRDVERSLRTAGFKVEGDE